MSTELAWAAGFWDGEGSACAMGNSGKNRSRHIKAGIAQNDREVLDRFHKAVGIGTVDGPYQYGRGRAGEYYSWQLGSAAGVRKLTHMLWPYLGTIKKRQLILALRAFCHEGIRRRKTHHMGPVPMRLVV